MGSFKWRRIVWPSGEGILMCRISFRMTTEDGGPDAEHPDQGQRWFRTLLLWHQRRCGAAPQIQDVKEFNRSSPVWFGAG